MGYLQSSHVMWCWVYTRLLLRAEDKDDCRVVSQGRAVTMLAGWLGTGRPPIHEYESCDDLQLMAFT